VNSNHGPLDRLPAALIPWKNGRPVAILTSTLKAAKQGVMYFQAAKVGGTERGKTQVFRLIQSLTVAAHSFSFIAAR
jgi:hypothetical protein